LARKGDFSEKIKVALARRVGDNCSNPDCINTTSGPHSDPSKVISSGQAAHIFSASEKGPRPNPSYSEEQFSSSENGIWLCGNCHAIVDADDSHHTPEQLYRWKEISENKAKHKQLAPAKKKEVDETASLIRQCWFHETTEDSDYVPRSINLKQLNSWAKDRTKKIITITGVGGQGKTSLVGYWVKKDDALNTRKFDGLLYWSFYSETDITIFLHSLLNYIGNNFFLDTSRIDPQDPLKSFRYIFSELSFLIILDGLEVIQHELSNRSKGQFVDSDLRYFLTDVCLSSRDSLAILTSRFEIVDLKQYSLNVENMFLGRLTNEESSSLLSKNFVGGSARDHELINEYLEGHPLALKLFSAGLSRDQQGNPVSYLHGLMDKLPNTDTPLSDKIERLLLTYEASLTDVQISILSAVSVLHRPMDEDSLVALSLHQRLGGSDDLNDLDILNALVALVLSGLVLKEVSKGKNSYSCHPIIRDYFRSKIVNKAENGRLIGNYLVNRPNQIVIEDADTLEWITSAIEVLSESGSWFDASLLYENKLNKGFLIKQLAKPEFGWRCANALYKCSRSDVESFEFYSGERFSLNDTRAFYANAAAQFSYGMGDIDNAVENCKKAMSLYSKAGLKNKAVTCNLLSNIYLINGMVFDAQKALKEAMELVNKVRLEDKYMLNEFHLTRGLIHFSSAEVKEAITRYSKVLTSFPKNQKKHTYQKVQSTIFLAEAKSYLGEYEEGLSFVRYGVKYAMLNEYQDLEIQGLLVEGNILLSCGEFSEAIDQLARAEKAARLARMEYWITKVSLAQARLQAKLGNVESALSSTEAVINVSSSRGFRLLRIDSLVAKAEILMLSNMDDIEVNVISDLLNLADHESMDCGYGLHSEIILAMQKLVFVDET